MVRVLVLDTDFVMLLLWVCCFVDACAVVFELLLYFEFACGWCWCCWFSLCRLLCYSFCFGLAFTVRFCCFFWFNGFWCEFVSLSFAVGVCMVVAVAGFGLGVYVMLVIWLGWWVFVVVWICWF